MSETRKRLNFFMQLLFCFYFALIKSKLRPINVFWLIQHYEQYFKYSNLFGQGDYLVILLNLVTIYK
jgi:hypothetical protein